MKTLLLLRHAVAANEPDDKKRPLTAHGRNQAKSIVRRMAKHFVPVDAIFSSSARRARQTAEICAEAAGYESEIYIIDALYDADVSTYMETIRGLNDEIQSAMFVGHNPEISGVLVVLTGESVGMGNSVLVSITLQIVSWAELQKGAGGLDGMQAPF